jgi:hypothetical protein
MDSVQISRETEQVAFPLNLPRGLFWDLPASVDLDPRTHGALIIARVVELGRMEDWRKILRYYGAETMKRVVTSARDLSPQTVALCCAAFDLTPQEFRCCTSRPFPPSPWIW